MKRKLALFIATAGGFGYCPAASGTAGTAVALPMAYIILHAGIPFQAAIILVGYFIFTWAAGLGNEIFGKHDAGQIVCDEVLGYWITVFAMPPDAFHLGLGFLLFRIFDIAKPFPASFFDKKVKGGHGVMLDDVVAGVYAHLGIRLWVLLGLGAW